MFHIVWEFVEEDEVSIIRYLSYGNIVKPKTNWVSIKTQFRSYLGTPQRDNFSPVLFIKYLKKAPIDIRSSIK